jgi:tetratricopeptide (TPR) repeat protein
MQEANGVLAAGAGDGVDVRLIRSHLARVVESPQFRGAPKLGRFLTFVVDTALAGQGGQIKESLIAVEVYGRPPDYNPQIDSTVRVEAGRLRARLRQYYETAGQDEPVEIELPKGRYVPAFRERRPSSTTPAPESQSSRPAPVFALMISAIVLFGIFALYYTAGRGLARDQTTASADPKAMESYLRAYELLRLPLPKDGAAPAVAPAVLEAVRLFEDVTRRDPAFTRGWVGLAEANEWLYEIDRNHPRERLAAAKAAVRRAIDLDPSLPEAWTILTSVLFFREWNIPAAEAACRRAIELSPRDTQAQQRRVDMLRLQGRHDEAVSGAAAAASVQPSNPYLRNLKALLLLETGRTEEAIQDAIAAENLNPSKQQMAYTMSLWIQAAGRQRQGRIEQAEALYRKALKHEPHDRWSEPSLAHLLAVTGRKAEAEGILAELNQQLAVGRARHKAIALVHLGLGQHEEAIAWLERGFAERDSTVLFTALDWRFDTLRSEPRFQALLARIRQTSVPDRNVRS